MTDNIVRRNFGDFVTMEISLDVCVNCAHYHGNLKALDLCPPMNKYVQTNFDLTVDQS